MTQSLGLTIDLPALQGPSQHRQSMLSVTNTTSATKPSSGGQHLKQAEHITLSDTALEHLYYIVHALLGPRLV